MKQILLLTFGAFLAYVTFTSSSSGPSTTVAGSQIAFNGCNGTSCHGLPDISTTASVILVNQSTGDTLSTNQYTPSTTYDLIVMGSNSSSMIRAFGFALTASHTSLTVQAGSFANNSTGTNISVPGTPGPLSVFEHAAPISSIGGSFSASIEWTSPAVGSGDATISLSVNAVDSNGASNNDQWVTNTATLAEGPPATVNEITAKDGIVLYPNPASNILNIQILSTNKKEYSYSIFGMDGTIIDAGVLNSPQNKVNTNDLPAGNYYIQIADDNNTTALPFVKL